MAWALKNRSYWPILELKTSQDFFIGPATQQFLLGQMKSKTWTSIEGPCKAFDSFPYSALSDHRLRPALTNADLENFREYRRGMSLCSLEKLRRRLAHSDNPNFLQRTNSLASTLPLSPPSYMTLVGWFGPSTSSRLLRIVGRACMVVVL